MMNLKVKVYSDSKYSKDSEKVAEAEYNNVVSREIKTIADEEIYNMGFDEVDECGEYAILTFDNGETSTFRNSHVDIFRA